MLQYISEELEALGNSRCALLALDCRSGVIEQAKMLKVFGDLSRTEASVN